jgi:hypothetical protein
VIAAMLIVGLVAGVMLQRNTAVGGAVQRQIEAYRVQHAVRGLQEGVEAWLGQYQPRTLPDVLDDDGFAFELDPRDGTRVLVHLFDGQGTARRTGIGVSADIAQDIELVAAEIFEAVGVDAAEPLLREVGPYAVSINAAPREVVLAVGEALVPEDQRSSIRDGLERLLEERRSDPLGQTEITQLVTSVGLTGTDRSRFTRFFTTQPELWEMRITVRGTGVRVPLGVLAKYRALVLVQPPTTGGNSFELPSPFLWWEEIPQDDPRFREDTGRSR